MAESKSDRVKFDGVTWVASRPQVLPVLTGIMICPIWGLLLTFHGTEAELIAASVATPDMFHDIRKSSQRRRWDEFGDRSTIKRRPGGKWDLELQLHKDGSRALPSDDNPRECDWWLKHGGEAKAATAAILARFAKSRP